MAEAAASSALPGTGRSAAVPALTAAAVPVPARVPMSTPSIAWVCGESAIAMDMPPTTPAAVSDPVIVQIMRDFIS
ncbi:hypothetical protein GB881_09850 [Georgenia subflava]|uniref:Uncharacterized protein n=1 Tax=Georgenia subflava TaxID=1622177 RepID=A0A6N7EMH8_9MICO|nr:hypothetical protein [Georgenia subflava]